MSLEKNKTLKSYSVEISEKISRTVEIQAISKRKALEEAERRYEKEEIMLDYLDYKGFICKIIDKKWLI